MKCSITFRRLALALLAVAAPCAVLAQPFVVNVTPAGPLRFCTGSSRTLTATTTYPGFAGGSGFNDDVFALVRQTDGKLLLGGRFTSYNGTACARVARLNPDGSLDAGFNLSGTGLNDEVHCLTLQADGKVLVGGNFTSYNGTAEGRILRLNTDGSLDATLVVGSPGFGSSVDAIVVQPDGKLLVGGDFNDYNGTARSHVARLNANGTLDSSFGAVPFSDGTVFTLARQADGKVLMGGIFTHVAGLARPRLARLLLDGSLDASFAPASTGADNDVTKILLQADGQVLIGGLFGSYDGSTRGHVARLNPDGTLDTSFAPTSSGFNSKVGTLDLLANGTLLVGGAFSSYNGTARSFSARLLADGTLDSSFAPSGTGFDGAVQALLGLPDGTVLVSGSFTDYNGTAQGHITHLNADGTLISGAPVAGVSYLWSNGLMTPSIIVSSTGSYSVTAMLGSNSATSNTVVVSVGSPPTISSFSPMSGPVGTLITVTGTNLDNLLNAKINTTPLLGVTVNAAGTSLTGQVAAGTTTTGPVSVANDCGGTTGNSFTVTGATAFQLLSTQPSFNAPAVPAAGTLTGVFNQPYDPSTLAALHLFSAQAGGHRALTGTVPGSGGPNSASVVPGSNFRPGERVDFTLTTAARSASTGQHLDRGHVRQFRIAAGAGPATLVAGASASVSGGALAPVLGDVNGDGKLDLLTANGNSPGTVSIRLGLGADSFAASGVNLSVGDTPYNLVLADFDNDGDLDLATANLGASSGTVSVRLNTGGTFGGGADIAIGTHPIDLAAGDLDADGDLDLLVADTFTSSTDAYALLNNGSGSFASAMPTNVASSADAVALADFNNDGYLDLVISEFESAGSLTYRLNTGSGTFGGGATLPLPGGGSGVDVGDFNADGYADIAVACIDPTTSAGTVQIYLNTGSGSFGAATSLAVGRYPWTVKAGDLDGDGDLDLVASNRGTSAGNVPLSVLLNNGSGSFTPGSAPCAYAYSYGLALADLDGDGDLDMVSAGTTTRAWLNQATVTAGIASFTPGSGAAGSSVVVTGTDFLGARAVSFNGTAATFIVNSATQLTATVPAGASSGLITVTTACGVVSSGSNFSITGCPDLSVSTTQTVPGGCYHNLTITGTGNATLGGDTEVFGDLVVADGAVLSDGCHGLTIHGTFTLGTTPGPLAVGPTLYVCSPQGIALATAAGAIQALGTYAPSTSANFVYNGTVPQQTGAGLSNYPVRSLTLANPAGVSLSQDVTILQTLALTTAGNFNLSGHTLNLSSDNAISGTALIVNAGTGVVVGNTAVVERSPNLAATYTGVGYHHYSSPVSGNTVANFSGSSFSPIVNSAYNTSADPANVIPFPNVYTYDQSRLATAVNNLAPLEKGWVSPNALTDALIVGRGYAVHFPGSDYLDFRGTLNTGPYTLTLPRDNSPTLSAVAGWHLVGNPYPAPLDYSLVAPADRNGLDAGIYVFYPTSAYGGSYRTYVNGIGGGSPLLAAGQGFYVRVTAGVTTATLQFRDAQRVTDFATQASFQRGAADTRPQVHLRLQAAAGLADDCYLYTEAGATAGVDATFDALKLPNPDGLNLSALAPTGEPLAIQGLPLLTAATIVPLTLSIPAAGTYALQVAQLLNLPAGTQVFLNDALTGRRINVTTLPTGGYTFTLTAAQTATAIAGRFFLDLAPAGTALATQVPQALSNAVSLFPNPAKANTTVWMPAVPGTSTVQATLLNALGQSVQTRQLALPVNGTAFTLELAGLAAGVYTLRLRAGTANISKRLVVE